MKKTFVLTVSKQFPKTHNRAGQTTGFVENITRLFTPECKKIHTIRANYELWHRRAKRVSIGGGLLVMQFAKRSEQMQKNKRLNAQCPVMCFIFNHFFNLNI